MWGGTRAGCDDVRRSEFQSTLPVWGGTADSLVGAVDAVISIHPPRVGRDWNGRNGYISQSRFQSTLPVWGGTNALDCVKGWKQISIHPPRVGRDILPIAV